jgi:hypothetical protein
MSRYFGPRCGSTILRTRPCSANGLKPSGVRWYQMFRCCFASEYGMPMYSTWHGDRRSSADRASAERRSVIFSAVMLCLPPGCCCCRRGSCFGFKACPGAPKIAKPNVKQKSLPRDNKQNSGETETENQHVYHLIRGKSRRSSTGYRSTMKGVCLPTGYPAATLGWHQEEAWQLQAFCRKALAVGLLRLSRRRCNGSLSHSGRHIGITSTRPSTLAGAPPTAKLRSVLSQSVMQIRHEPPTLARELCHGG